MEPTITFELNNGGPTCRVFYGDQQIGILERDDDGHWWGSLTSPVKLPPRYFTFIAAELHHRNEISKVSR